MKAWVTFVGLLMIGFTCQARLGEDERQPQVASRVTALQGGIPGTMAPPTVDMGTRMADRNTSSPR